MPPMDAYTEETRAWLDRRFEETAPDGVYVAHQPIYGFDAGHCEPSLLPRYVRTLEIMRALAQLRFRSCLDAGAAEGYKAELVRRLFGAEVMASDLSENACRRAREIFGLEARAGDIHDLPFEDGQFDVALCSETLEHVSDFRSGLAELLRVSRVAVVVTVPHESQDRVEENRDSGEPHAHINSFSLDTLDYLEREQGLRVIARPIVSPLDRGGGRPGGGLRARAARAGRQPPHLEPARAREQRDRAADGAHVRPAGGERPARAGSSRLPAAGRAPGAPLRGAQGPVGLAGAALT